jgi:radical SAM superfamily enzyme YgiQ (UPF0313 family)
LADLISGLRGMGLGVSVSSMRVKPISEDALRQLAEAGAKTITLAPEAGSERLRAVLKKGINEDDILEAVRAAGDAGFRQVKLYVMAGLPTETNEDISGLTDLVLKCKAILDRKGAGLSLNIAPFVPKAGTPFQWLGMASLPVLRDRISFIKASLAPKGVKVKSESGPWSEVQAVLSRGGREVAEVIARSEGASLPNWRRASAGLDLGYYAHQTWEVGRPLPWGFIDLGVSGRRLELELVAALG